MQTRARTVLFVGAVCLIIGSIAFYRVTHPIVSIHAFRAFTDFTAVGVLPLTRTDEDRFRRLITEAHARRDPDAGSRLLNSIRSEFSNSGIEIPKTESGLYRRRCPKGHALVFHLDGEGYGYFVFVNINGPMDIELDAVDNGFEVLPTASRNSGSQ